MDRFLWMLGLCSASMAALTLLLWGFTSVLRKRYSARCLAVVWMVLLVGFLIPLRPQAKAPIVTVNVPSAMAVQHTLPAGNAAGTGGDLVAAPITQGESRINTQAAPVRWDRVILGAWLGGAFAVLAMQLIEHHRFMRAMRRWSRPCAPAVWNCYETIRTLMGIRRPIALRICKAVDSPMLAGLLKPVIYLPDREIATLDLDLILRHELTHYRRHDLWGRALSMLVVSMHWFNPAARLAARGLSDQSEAACDAAVLRGLDLDTRIQYGRTILNMLRGGKPMRTVLSTRYTGGKKGLKRRMMDILEERGTRVGILMLATVWW